MYLRIYAQVAMYMHIYDYCYIAIAEQSTTSCGHQENMLLTVTTKHKVSYILWPKYPCSYSYVCCMSYVCRNNVSLQLMANFVIRLSSVTSEDEFAYILEDQMYYQIHWWGSVGVHIALIRAWW